MHGRLKVRTSQEQQEAKTKERQKKLEVFRAAKERIFEKRESQEFDEEGLKLTGEVLAANPDYYTIWNIRKEMLISLKHNKSAEDYKVLLETELHFLEACLKVNPKSYSTWHHRSWTVDQMPTSCWMMELHLCNKYLEYDERNFHCWDYRRLVVKKAAVTLAAEFDFTTEKINSNFSNFSSWHYRSKILPVLFPDTSHYTGVQEDILLQEFEKVQNAFFTDPDDQSAWFYHRWLLGKRGVPKLNIKSIYVSKKLSRVAVCLSEAVKIDKDCCIHLVIQNKELVSKWFTPEDHGYSQLWLTFVDHAVLTGTQDIIISVCLNDDERCECVLTTEMSEASWMAPKQPRVEMTTATSGILMQELESCQQLHQLEPGNKWTLLTIILLMRATDPTGFEQQTMQYIEKLQEIDPMRYQYYKDLRSKFIVENYIRRHERVDEICIVDHELTILCTLDNFLLTTELNMHSNNLKRLPRCYYLQRLRSLVLDCNKFISLQGFQHIPQLTQLSLANNAISTVEDLQPLASCSHLDTLNIQGNPVCKVAGAKDSIRTMLSHVKHISL